MINQGGPKGTMITQVETMINYDKPRWPRGTLATQAKTMMNYDNKDGHTAVPIGIMMRYLIYGFIAMSIPYEWVHDYSSTSILIWKLGRRGFTLNTHPLRKHLFQVHRSKKTSHRGRLCQIMVRFLYLRLFCWMPEIGNQPRLGHGGHGIVIPNDKPR